MQFRVYAAGVSGTRFRLAAALLLVSLEMVGIASGLRAAGLPASSDEFDFSHSAARRLA